MGFLTGKEESESTSKLPSWMSEPAKQMLQRSLEAAQTGYMPYAGPEVAALDPMQIASMQNAAGAADAFGLASAQPNIPQATDFGGGVMGYSSMPLYDQQMAWMEQNRPGQLGFYNSLFVDPVTGAVPAGYGSAGAGGNQYGQVSTAPWWTPYADDMTTGQRTYMEMYQSGNGDPRTNGRY